MQKYTWIAKEIGGDVERTLVAAEFVEGANTDGLKVVLRNIRSIEDSDLPHITKMILPSCPPMQAVLGYVIVNAAGKPNWYRSNTDPSQLAATIFELPPVPVDKINMCSMPVFVVPPDAVKRIAELRDTIIQTVRALGGAGTDAVTNEFLSLVPDEARLVKEKLDAALRDLEQRTRERDLLKDQMATMRRVLESADRAITAIGEALSMLFKEETYDEFADRACKRIRARETTAWVIEYPGQCGISVNGDHLVLVSVKDAIKFVEKADAEAMLRVVRHASVSLDNPRATVKEHMWIGKPLPAPSAVEYEYKQVADGSVLPMLKDEPAAEPDDCQAGGLGMSVEQTKKRYRKPANVRSMLIRLTHPTATGGRQ